MSGGAGWAFRSEVWRVEGPGGWYFISLPPGIADEIAEVDQGVPAAAFGSVKVAATIGMTTWRTSLFPDRAHRTYLLPVKAAVRSAEGLDDGVPVEVRLVLG